MVENDLAWENETSATHLWLVLSKAYRAIAQNALESIAGTQLGLSDFAVLEVLLHKGALPVNTIGKKVLLTSGSISTAIDRLQKRGLVRRSVDEVDRRSRIVQLSEAGRRLIKAAFERHTRDMEEALAVLSAPERREMVRLLRKAGLWAQARAEKRCG